MQYQKIAVVFYRLLEVVRRHQGDMVSQHRVFRIEAEFLQPAGTAVQVLGLQNFYQFAAPLMRQLGWPTLFCHDLEIDGGGRVAAYRLRQTDPKRRAVQAFHGLNFQTIAAGDSYNDTTMLAEADAGILFRPPDNVIAEFPQFPVTHSYEELRAAFDAAADALPEPERNR